MSSGGCRTGRLAAPGVAAPAALRPAGRSHPAITRAASAVLPAMVIPGQVTRDGCQTAGGWLAAAAGPAGPGRWPAAQAAICVREENPSLARMLATWRATVAGLMTS